jgi:hypothetical protein
VRTKTTIGVLVLVLAFYAALIGFKGLELLDSGSRVGQVLGVALLVMPLLGLYVVRREAADALFAEMREQTEARPEDWRSWFRLALAYDAAGDRTRARAAARRAISLHAVDQRV